MKSPLVNIIIVTYQQYDFTDKCLRSIFSCKYKNLKIYLVDNNSESKIYQAFYKKYRKRENLIFIRLRKNYGFGEGCNKAIRKIKRGYIVFLNNDTEVEKSWLNPAIKFMEKNKHVGACQPKIKYLYRKQYFEYAGAAGGMMDVYGYPFARGRIFFTAEKDIGQYDNITDLVWCSGTAMITKKSVLNEVGGFDEIFFMYGEEADLCWRINHAGYKLVSIPKSVVYHHGMGSMKKNPGYKKMYLTHRNGLILLLKNYTLSEWFRYVSVRVGLDFVSFFYYLIKSPTNLNWASLIFAYFSVFLTSPKIVKKHLEIRQMRLNSKMIYPPLYKRSIVWDYFMKKRVFFKDLPKKDFLKY